MLRIRIDLANRCLLAVMSICSLATGSSTVSAQAIVAWSPGPLDARPAHNSPEYVAKNIDLIESRPFDGMVINEFFGRNLFNLGLRKIVPDSMEVSADAISYKGAAKSLAPLKGAFKVFKNNFVKVNMFLTSMPPLLHDDAGWQVALTSARNYGRAVADAGLRGIMFDNESYLRPKDEKQHALDYWNYGDQLTLGGVSAGKQSLEATVDLARLRGRQFMAALASENPTLVLILAHGPYMGCTSARDALWSTGRDDYLLGAFAAGMVEAATTTNKIVDGGELYDYRTNEDFRISREWRKGDEKNGRDSMTNLDSRRRCLFMDRQLASIWPNKISIAFGTFDKKRISRETNEWKADNDAATYSKTLTYALQNADDYVWHYTQWQDWWGSTTDKELVPFIAAIREAKLAATRLPIQ